jgi:glycosyltransferase involved in cell wall biosynthesis
LKILHLLYESQGDYFGIGGVGMRAYEIYSRIAVRHDITLLCKKYPGARDGQIRGLSHIFVGSGSENFTVSLLSYACLASRFVSRYCDDFDIIVEEFSPAIPTFLHTCTKKPLVLQIQGHTGGLYFRKYNLLYASILWTMEYLRPCFYNNFIFINKESISKFLLPRKKKRTEIIPNGISSELLEASSDEGDYILYLGRIDIYGKGLDVLIAAYEKFHRSFPEIRLVIAGNGRDKEAFDRLLSKIPRAVRTNVELAGWVAGNRKKELISHALFCVFPSRHEVQPIAILEALACAKAVIVSDIAEFSFVTEKGAGLAFKSGDKVDLARVLISLTLNRERHFMGQKGRLGVKDQSWDSLALRFEEFLSGVLQSIS